MDIPSLLLPRFYVDYDGSDVNGRYYMLEFRMIGNPYFVIYDSEEKKFYDWDSSLTFVAMRNMFGQIKVIGHYASNMKYIDIYMYESELKDLFSEDIMLYYTLEHLIKGAERAIIEYLI